MLAGGLTVSVFSLCGSGFKPKSFAGIFGAAPSVATVSLAIVFARQGRMVAELQARSMLLGSIGFVAYASMCIALTKRSAIPVGVGAILSWLAFGAVALALFAAMYSLARSARAARVSFRAHTHHDSVAFSNKSVR
jgi:hypothetical protein